MISTHEAMAAYHCAVDVYTPDGQAHTIDRVWTQFGVGYAHLSVDETYPLDTLTLPKASRRMVDRYLAVQVRPLSGKLLQ